MWVRLLRGYAGTIRVFNAQLSADHGLTINDYEALLALTNADDSRMRLVDLAANLQLTPSGVTRLVKRLEKTGLVERVTCPRDARVTYAVLSDSGMVKLQEASSSHLAAVRALFEERFTEGELRALADLLGRLPGAEDANPGHCTAGGSTPG
ncbi:MAG: MarR family transcriptional regulator [Thermoleophilia bacterium]